MSTSSGRKSICSRCGHANNEHARASESKCGKCKKKFEICQAQVHGGVVGGWKICFQPCACGKKYFPDKAKAAQLLLPHEYLSDHPAYRPEEDVDYFDDDDDDDLQGQFDKLRVSDAVASSSATGDQGQPNRADERKGKAGKEGKGKGKASKKGANEEVGAEWIDWDSAINLWKRWDPALQIWIYRDHDTGMPMFWNEESNNFDWL
ncbi:hypothetical protein F5Y03DRAFT_316394 [Xylaria venustula]|nr:hypothetical protein F5Y03DRAFT_316394 [Xylaria venustula]